MSQRSQSALWIRGGRVVTMNPQRQVFEGDVLIVGQRISVVGSKAVVSRAARTLQRVRVIDAHGSWVIPGLIQAHTHLCQTLFRGLADDLELLDWLKDRIWPMEHAHNARSIRAAALLGCLEMQKCGTTAILDMGTVAHTHELLEAVATTGLRYWGGKCFMDLQESSGPLFEPMNQALRESEELISQWREHHPLVQYALCPRFAISCSDAMLEATAGLSREHDLLIHTHASENREEVAQIRARTGMGNIEFLKQKGILSQRTVVAHGIHVSEEELSTLIAEGTSLAHCPASNLKLASGIASIHRYLQRGLNLAIGCDGAACNNLLDPFQEMRLVALLQKPFAGSTALPAEQAFALATLGGARALGMEQHLGSIEVGKFGDIVIVDRNSPNLATVENPYSALVYGCTGRDVDTVVIDGQVVVRSGEHLRLDEEQVLKAARKELRALQQRI